MIAGNFTNVFLKLVLFWLVAVLSGAAIAFPTTLVGDDVLGGRRVVRHGLATPSIEADVLHRDGVRRALNNADEESTDLAQRSGNFGSRNLPRRVLFAKRRVHPRPIFPRTAVRNTTDPTEHINVVIASKQTVSAAPRRKEEPPAPTETQSSWYHYQNTPHDVQIVSVRVSTSVGKAAPQHPFSKLDDTSKKPYARLEPFNEVGKKPESELSSSASPPTEKTTVPPRTTSEEPPSLPVPLPQVLLAENDDYAYRPCDHESTLCLDHTKDDGEFGQKSRSSIRTQSAPSSYQTSHLSVDETSQPSVGDVLDDASKTPPTPSAIPDTRTSPTVVYHTRVSTQTSGSTVTVYSKAIVGSSAETIHSPVVMEAPHDPVAPEKQIAFEPTSAVPVAHIPENHGQFLHHESEMVRQSSEEILGPTEASHQSEDHSYLQTTQQEYQVPDKDHGAADHVSSTETVPSNRRYLQRLTTTHQEFNVPEKSKTPVAGTHSGSTEPGVSGRFLQRVTTSHQEYKVPEKSDIDYVSPVAGAHFGSTEPGTTVRHTENRGRYLHRVTSRQEYKLPEKPERDYGAPERVYSQPEENYEVDEAVSVMTNGRAHGVQPQSTSSPPYISAEEAEKKSGYVVEGRNFRKYRVEERTPDGFIVGEYGVVSHDDGSLRGVRYTADGTINPRLIYDALLKFLNL